jgi:hypothetical protein
MPLFNSFLTLKTLFFSIAEAFENLYITLFCAELCEMIRQQAISMVTGVNSSLPLHLCHGLDLHPLVFANHRFLLTISFLLTIGFPNHRFSLTISFC